MNLYREIAVQALEHFLGGDCAKIKDAFQLCTPEELNDFYGSTGMLRSRVLEQCKEREAVILATIDWIKSIE